MSEQVAIPKGTLVHVAGMPFWLSNDTPAEGRQVNLDAALSAVAEMESAPRSGVGSAPGIAEDKVIEVKVRLHVSEPMTWDTAMLAAALALLHQHGPKRIAEIDVTGAIHEMPAHPLPTVLG